MDTPQNTTEQQQHLDDLVKLIKLAREDVENDTCNDHQIACDILLYLQYASYKYKNGWQNFNLATVTQLFEEKMKMETLNKDNIRISCCNNEDSTRIDTDSYFDFPDYSSNDESSDVLDTNINDDSPVFKNLSRISSLYTPSQNSIISSQRSSNASNFSSSYSSLTQGLPEPRVSITMKELQRDLSNHINYYQELDRLNNDPSIPCNLDSFRPVLQNSSKYGSNVISAFLESDWPSDDEDETPFSSLIKERGQALYEEKRRQAEANSRGTCDPGSVSLVQVRKAFPINESNNMLESSKIASKKIVKNTIKGKKLNKTNKRSKKQTNSTIPQITTSTDSMTSSSLSNTVPGLQVISPRTIISGLSFSEFDQQIEEQERSQTSIKGTKRKVRECDDVTENLVPGDFDVDKMFDDFDPTAHSINVTPGTMYNQLLADISPSIRNRFAANSPGQEFDYLWATYNGSANKRSRKSPKFKEQMIDFEPKLVETRNNTIPSSYQASLDAWAATDAIPTSQAPILIEVPSTPPHQIRSASGARTPGSAFSLSEFLNLSPSLDGKKI